jgi:hypothetical protein
MKKILLSLLIFYGTLRAQVIPACGNDFYSLSGYNNITTTLGISNLGIPNSFTVISLTLPTFSNANVMGLALGSSFGYTSAPNPTFWTAVYANGGSSYYYYNGSTWVNTGHSIAYNGSALGSSANYIYSLVSSYTSSTRFIYKYNATGNASLVTSGLSAFPCITGDDQDNFYLINALGLHIYDQGGTPICSYSVTGLTNTVTITALSIQGNTVNVMDIYEHYYVGIRQGSAVDFTLTTASFPLGAEGFASCPNVTKFSSSVTASPNPTINCLQTITLTANPAISATNFIWSGPGMLGSINNQSLEVNYPGVYSCTMTNSDCPPRLSISTCTVINGGGFFTPTLTSAGDLACLQPTTQLISSQNMPQYTYLWSGPGVVSGSTSPTVTVNAAGAYTAIVTNTLTGCTGTQVISLGSSITTLSLNINASSTLICLPSSSGVTLTASGADSYNWLSQPSLSSNSGSIVVANPNATYLYYVVGTTGVCTGTTGIIIWVQNTPTLTNTTANNTVCAGSTCTLSVSGASNYTWLPGNSHGSLYPVNPQISASYFIIGESNGCYSQPLQVTVIVNPLPNITVVGTPSYQCASGVGTSTLNASGASTYTWITSGSTTSSVVISPSVTANYSVSGTDSFGCISSTSFQYSVLPSYTPALSASGQLTVCEGSLLILDAGTPTSTWQPGGFVGIYLYTTPTANIIYTVTGVANGYCPGSNTISIYIFNSPLVVTPSQTTMCTGQSITITPSGANSFTYYPSGNLIFPQFDPSFTLAPMVTTIYTLVAAVPVPGFGTCYFERNVTVTVNPTPTLTAISNSIVMCEGKSAVISATGAPGYTWMPGAVTNSSITVSPSVTTIYTVTGATNFCSTNKTVPININPKPQLTVTPSSFPICLAPSTTLTASGAYSYIWFPAIIGGNTLVQSLPLGNTTYTVFGTSALGCTNTAIVNLTVIPSLTVSVSGSSGPICSGSSTSFTASGAPSYTWMPGNLNSSIANMSPFSTTAYTVTGSNSVGCTHSIIKTVTVIPTPTLQSSYTPALVCDGKVTPVNITGASNYTWQPGNLSGATNSIIPFGNTLLTITGANGSCTSTYTLLLNANPSPTVVPISSAPGKCPGQNVVLTANGGVSYTWMPGNSSNTSLTVSPLQHTTYTLTGKNQIGCDGSGTVTVFSYSNPIISATPQKTIACQGEPVVIQAIGADTYTWSNNATGDSITVYPPASFLVSGTSNEGCSSNTYAVNVSADPCTGINAKNGKEYFIKIYPNPNNGLFVIESDVTETSIEVRNILNQLVLREELLSNPQEINILPFPNGIYTVTIYKNQQQIGKTKLIKQ